MAAEKSSVLTEGTRVTRSMPREKLELEWRTANRIGVLFNAQAQLQHSILEGILR